MGPQVILVDEMDRPVGQRDKLAAHVSGELHRAFSIFLFDRDGRWLLQQRHPEKYHSGGLWTNACCSHPAPGETTPEAASDRLRHEMGITVPIEPAFQFLYRTRFENDLIEHELDHVFVGRFDGEPVPNPAEVSAWRWVEPFTLQDEMSRHPERFTYWFREVADRVRQHVALP
jgi:isopentenyl-diphosphate delta-isomerase